MAVYIAIIIVAVLVVLGLRRPGRPGPPHRRAAVAADSYTDGGVMAAAQGGASDTDCRHGGADAGADSGGSDGGSCGGGGGD